MWRWFVGTVVEARKRMLRKLSRSYWACPVECHDYVMVLDKTAIEIANDDDLTRLVRHELRHCFHDIDSDKKP